MQIELSNADDVRKALHAGLITMEDYVAHLETKRTAAIAEVTVALNYGTAAYLHKQIEEGSHTGAAVSLEKLQTWYLKLSIDGELSAAMSVVDGKVTNRLARPLPQ